MMVPVVRFSMAIARKKMNKVFIMSYFFNEGLGMVLGSVEELPTDHLDGNDVVLFVVDFELV